MRRSVGVLLLLCGIASAHPGSHHDLAQATDALGRDPGAADVWLLRAALYRGHGEYRRSLADLDQAARRGADAASLDLQRGLTLAAMDRHLEAVGSLTRSIEARPAWATYVARGRSFARLGRDDATVPDLDAALAMRPQVDVYLERGAALRRLGRLEEAAAGYRDALSRLGPATVIVDPSIDLELALDRIPAALALIDAQLQRGPDTHWLLRRAEALAVAGDDAGRAATLEQALAVADAAVAKRGTAINLVARARVHLARGGTALARADVRTALERAPSYRAAQELSMLTGATP